MHGHIQHVAPDGTVTDVTAAVQALYDLAISSMDFRSGFWSYEDAKPVAELGEVCGFEGVEGIRKYHDDQLEQVQQSAFIWQHQVAINPRRGFIDEYDARHEALIRHEHTFSTLGKCMWPGCIAKE